MSRRKLLLLLIIVFLSTPVSAQLWQRARDSMSVAMAKGNNAKIIKIGSLLGDDIFTPERKNKKYQADICYLLGSAYLNADQFEQGEKFLQLARELFISTQNKNGAYASACNNLGNLYLKSGKFDTAEIYLVEAINHHLSQSSTYTNKILPPYLNLADVYASTKRIEKSDSVIQVLKKLIPRENTTDLFMITGYIAMIFINTENFNKAEQVITTMLADGENNFGDQSIHYAKACVTAGRYYYDTKDFLKAEKWIIKALRIYEFNKDQQNPAYLPNSSNLAYAYLFSGRIKEADSVFNLNLKMAEQKSGKESIDYIYAINGKSLTLFNTKEYPEAIRLLEESIAIQEKFKQTQSRLYKSLLNNLAAALERTGQAKKAESLYLRTESLTAAQFGKDHSEYRTICFNLAFFYWGQGRITEAMAYSRQGINVVKKTILTIFSYSSESEKLQFINTLGVERQKIYSMIYQIGQGENSDDLYDLNLFSNGLLLNSVKQLNKAITNNPDTVVRQLYEKWQNNKNQLAYWNSKPATERNINLDSIQAITEQLEKKLVRISSNFRDNQSGITATWKDIQQKLQPDEAAIEFIRFNYFDKDRLTDSIIYAALVLKKFSLKPEMVTLFEQHQIDSLLNSTKGGAWQTINQLYNPSSSNNPDNKLYQLIWPHIEKKLEGISTIYFAPTGSLLKISFAALSINATSRLSDKYRMVQLHSTRSVLEITAEIIFPTDSLLLYGGIAYDADTARLKQIAGSVIEPDNVDNNRFVTTAGESWNYLPFSYTEVKEINKNGLAVNYPVKVISGENATEESFKSLNGKKSPAVLHIATHGFFYPDPKENAANNQLSKNVFKYNSNPLLRSGLFFAGAYYTWTKNSAVSGIEDGVATAYEIANLYLPTTKLAVLSACETGLGELSGSDGVQGLQRAFRIAGVKNLVMSLWKVPDNETAEFMISFYEKLFDKQPISDAFNTTQKFMKDKYPNEPYKWAAFLLVR